MTANDTVRTTIRMSTVALLLAVVAVSGAIELGLLASARPASAASLQSDVGTGFTYSGELEEDGVPVTGFCAFEISLWDAEGTGSLPDSGSQIGSAVELPNVHVVDGKFSVYINENNEFGGNAFDGDARWLQIALRCHGDGPLKILSPRQEIHALPIARSLPANSNIRARQVDAGRMRATSSNREAAFAAKNQVGGKAMEADNNDPEEPAFAAKNTGGGRAAQAENDSDKKAAFAAKNTGGGRAAEVENQGDEEPAFAAKNIGPGSAVKAYGRGSQRSKAVVQATNESVSGYATGVKADVISPDGTAIIGSAEAETGPSIGIYGENMSTSGHGMKGWNTATEGIGNGLLAGTSQPYGRGAYVINEAPTGSGTGLYAVVNSDDAYAIRAIGKTTATGTNAFQMDHPLNPANEYLNHFSAEGPEPYFIYRGTAMLGEDGTARIELPDYFEVINRDYHYQLTPIGGAAPELHVASEIHDNSFQVAGGHAGLKVSWTVTGVRDDPWVRANGADDVMQKPPSERGYYLDPELHGQPGSMWIAVQSRAPSAPGQDLDNGSSAGASGDTSRHAPRVVPQ